MSKIDQLKSMLRTKKGLAFGLQELVATLIIIGVMLMIGVWLWAQVIDTVSLSDFDYNGTGTDNLTVYNDYNDTFNNVTDTTLDAMDLAVVALIVLAAAAIIGILVKAFS